NDTAGSEGRGGSASHLEIFVTDLGGVAANRCDASHRLAGRATDDLFQNPRRLLGRKGVRCEEGERASPSGLSPAYRQRISRLKEAMSFSIQDNSSFNEDSSRRIENWSTSANPDVMRSEAISPLRL